MKPDDDACRVAATPAEAPRTVPGRGWTLAAILLSAFGVGISLGLATPLVSVFLEARGYGSGTIGLTASTYAMATLALAAFVPVLASRYGAVRCAVVGGLAAAAALAAFPHMGGLAAYLLLRVIMGIGNSLEWIISETWINRLATERDRGRVVALYATVWGSGVGVGPLVLQVTGTEGSLPFVVGSVLMVLTTVPVLLVRRRLPSLRPDGKRTGLSLIVRGAPVAMLAGLLCGYTEGAFFSLAPVYALEMGATTAAAVAFSSVFAIGSVALQPPTGWLADRVDRTRLLLATALLALACTIGLPLLTSHQVALWPTIFIWGGAAAGFYTLGLVRLGQRFAAQDMASANAAFIMAYTTGMIIGPSVTGVVMSGLGPGLFPLPFAAAYLGLVLLLLFGLRRRPRVPVVEG